jgi:uracil-DNA glycosylase family 4
MTKAELLNSLIEEMGDCRRCKLHSTRSKIVFGDGNPEARVIFIGEGPGKDEDLQGRPFVGRAGKLLTAIIEKGMQMKRSDVYIANIVKCRPTVDMEFVRDRPPDEEETLACSGFLMRQIEIIHPEVIVTLGNPSTKFLLNTAEGITKIRGKWFSYKGIPVMPTYHPSFVLRNGGEQSPKKKEVWEDIKKVISKLKDPSLEIRVDEKKGNEIQLEGLRDKKKDGEKQGKLF